MQSMIGEEIGYSPISILSNSIPGWGTCRSKIGQRLILSDILTSGAICYKCLKFTIRSVNVIQIHSHGLYQCHTTYKEAMSSCSDNVFREEIMLYKKLEYHSDSSERGIVCPLQGRWTIAETQNLCKRSEVRTCPMESRLDVILRYCFDFSGTHKKNPIHFKFECIGHWDDNGLKYLALLDAELPLLGERSKPQYRCAVSKMFL